MKRVLWSPWLAGRALQKQLHALRQKPIAQRDVEEGAPTRVLVLPHPAALRPPPPRPSSLLPPRPARALTRRTLRPAVRGRLVWPLDQTAWSHHRAWRRRAVHRGSCGQPHPARQQVSCLPMARQAARPGRTHGASPRCTAARFCCTRAVYWIEWVRNSASPSSSPALARLFGLARALLCGPTPVPPSLVPPPPTPVPP